MYITDLRLSALALFFSVTLVLTAAQFVPTGAETCGDCVTDAPTRIESVVPVTAVDEARAPSDIDWTMS